jgi:NTE family protein
MMTNRARQLIIILFLLPFALHIAIPALSDELPVVYSPKVGLALSGGGARGAAHIGILKILEREGIPIDYIAGVSMGALTGGLYAIGYSPAEIEKFLVDQDWNSVFSDAPQWRFTPLSERADSRYQGKIALRGWSLEIPGGLWGGQRFTEELDVLTSGPMLRAQNDFDKLPIPFRAVATNLVDGKPYIFRQGSMTQALRASMAVPMMFTPIEAEDALLVDGGLANNLPTDIVREMGADIIIAIDVSTPLLDRKDLRTLFDVIDQSISLQIVRNVEENRKLASIVLSPDLDAYSNTSYDKVREIVKQGEEAAERHMDEIRALVAGITPRRPRSDTVAETAVPIIDVISFSGLNKVPAKQVENKILLQPGDVADPVAIAAEVSRIYAMRLFESVSYTLEPAGENRYRLIFMVREDILNTIGAGIRYDNDYGFTILSEFITRQIFNTPSRAVISSQFGGLEYHTASFRYVPFQSGFFYLEPKIEISRQKRRNWGDKARTYRFMDKREAGEIILGGTISRQVEFSAGYRIEHVRVSDVLETREWQGAATLAGLTARVNWDSLDFPEYPRSGRQFSVQFEKRETRFGSDSDSTKGLVEYRRYVPLSDKGTFRMELLAGYSEGSVSFYDLFFAGGNSRSSRGGEPFLGFGADEIASRQMAVARFSYYHRVLARPLSILKQGYMAATYNGGVFSEHGTSPYDFQNLNGFGAGLALDTRAGPLRMTLGWGEGGRVNFYISFGPSF